MPQGTIICEHCGRTNIVRDREAEYAVVQEKSKETSKPIGDPKIFFIFKCRSCGKRFYLEKSETPAN
jgi:ribosomal protein L37E